MARYGMARLVQTLIGPQHWPVGTFAVNLIGSFLIGAIYVVITEKTSWHPDWRYVLIVGFLGAFTTFSTFSLETVALLESGKLITAASYMLITVVTCVLGCWLGIQSIR